MIWALAAVLILLGLCAAHTALTLHAFIKIMAWKKAGLSREHATPRQRLFWVYGLILDIAYNYAPWGGSLVLWSWPRRGETLFTDHLKRIRGRGYSRRYTDTVALIYCIVLNHFDTNHCED